MACLKMLASFLSSVYQMGLERCITPMEMFTREIGKMANITARCFVDMIQLILFLSPSHRSPYILS